MITAGTIVFAHAVTSFQPSAAWIKLFFSLRQSKKRKPPRELNQGGAINLKVSCLYTGKSAHTG